MPFRTASWQRAASCRGRSSVGKWAVQSSQELIASNGIHAGVVLGPEQPLPSGLDLNAEQVSVLINGSTVAAGVCSQIMDGPLHSMRWLVNHAASRGLHLRAGELIIPGSAVELVRVAPEDRMEARFENLGSCLAQLSS